MSDESGGDADGPLSAMGERMIAGMNEFLDVLKSGERIEDHFAVKAVFRCAMCGGVFEKTWSDNEALGEAIIKGIKSEDIADGCLVCDDCYRMTPWGGESEEN
jgi:hypothetical protein